MTPAAVASTRASDSLDTIWCEGAIPKMARAKRMVVDDRLDPEETAHRRAGREVAKRRQVA
jgi:hypothetical protein